MTKFSKNCVGNILQHLSVTFNFWGRKICSEQIVGDITVHHCMIRDINQSPNSLKVQINAKLITQTLFWLNLCDPNRAKVSPIPLCPFKLGQHAQMCRRGIHRLSKPTHLNILAQFERIPLYFLYSLHTIGKHIFDEFLWFFG